MVLHVLERAALSGAERVVLATDSTEVAELAESSGFESHLTGDCDSGSKRVAAAVNDLYLDGVVVNLQCDEPEIDPGLVTEVAGRAGSGGCDCATAAAPISGELAANPDVVKVVTDRNDMALYFSRAAIPAQRDGADDGQARCWGHVGIYGFAPGKAKDIAAMEASSLEASERLEQLSWLWHGWKIAVIKTGDFTCGIDSPRDLDEANARLAECK